MVKQRTRYTVEGPGWGLDVLLAWTKILAGVAVLHLGMTVMRVVSTVGEVHSQNRVTVGVDSEAALEGDNGRVVVGRERDGKRE